MEKEKHKTIEDSKCNHCHLCRNHCVYLDKYQIDIGDTAKLKELAFSCFLCGECTRRCPKGIDGREKILEMRRERASKKNKPDKKGYELLLAEKKNYLFQNYRHAKEGSALFLGCNFPSFYPKTTKALEGILKQRAGIGVIYDCCGKPIAELGMSEQEDKIIQRLEERLKMYRITELIMVCPNCYAFLNPRLSIPVVSIYEKLIELKIGERGLRKYPIFIPCPDKKDNAWFSMIQVFMEKQCPAIPEVQCCGLGGCASIQEPELAKKLTDKLSKKGDEMIYTYCASCSGNLTRNGCHNVKHVLTEILGVHEQVDATHSMRNRILTKFK